jgi:hypothetical protein
MQSLSDKGKNLSRLTPSWFDVRAMVTSFDSVSRPGMSQALKLVLSLSVEGPVRALTYRR